MGCGILLCQAIIKGAFACTLSMSIVTAKMHTGTGTGMFGHKDVSFGEVMMLILQHYFSAHIKARADHDTLVPPGQVLKELGDKFTQASQNEWQPTSIGLFVVLLNAPKHTAG